MAIEPRTKWRNKTAKHDGNVVRVLRLSKGNRIVLEFLRCSRAHRNAPFTVSVDQFLSQYVPSR